MTLSNVLTNILGEWKSPIEASSITSSTVNHSNILRNDHTGELFWVELNEETKGRQTIMTKSPNGVIEEVTPAPFVARTRVHEYGGDSFSLGSNFLVSTNDVDCRLYKIDTATKRVTPLTPKNPDLRYADIAIHPSERFLICVREDHTVDTPQTVINTLVAVRLDTEEPNVQVLVEGADFYAGACFNPKNPSEFAYYSWNHPYMNFDHTQLYYGQLESNDTVLTVTSQTLLAGADETAEESNNQPRFGDDGTLYFLSDRTGFWNLYSYKSGGKIQLVLKEPMEAEFQRKKNK